MNSTLPAGWPERTLGWGVLHWCSKYLRQPDGPHAGDRWHFTDSQRDFVLWLYAVDENGDWLFRRGALRWAKGKGKSPMLAALCLAELCADVVFDHFDDDDKPVGRLAPMPWVQIAATAEWQTVNTMSMVSAMCPKSSRLAREKKLDIGKTRIYRPGGGRLEVISASAPAAEGNRPTFVVLDEVQEWTHTNGGHALARTIRRNLAKTGGRSVEAGNAHVPGGHSVAEETWDAWQLQQQGKLRTAGVLYDSLEAPAETNLADEGSLRVGLKVAYTDAPWADLDRIMAEVQDYNTPPEDARRYYLNQIWAASESWLAQPEWASCTDATKVVADRDVVVLGFDGSRGRAKGKPDATALVGCRVEDGHVFQLGVWEAGQNQATWADWAPPLVEIEAAVAAVFTRYRVVGFYADPAKDWKSHVNAWEAKYGVRIPVKATRDHPFEWWMTGGRSGLIQRAVEQFEGAVRNGDLTHDGSWELTAHVLNSRRVLRHGKLGLGKESDYSNRKIDAAVAAVLAWQARLDAVAAGVGTSTPGRGRVIALN